MHHGHSSERNLHSGIMRLWHALVFFLFAQSMRVSAVGDTADATPSDGPIPSSTVVPLSLITSEPPRQPSATLSTYTASTSMNCSASWMAWLTSSQNFRFGTFSTFYTTWTYHNMTAKVTTLCDGHPRIVGGINGLTTTATGTTSVQTISQLDHAGNFTVPTPKCVPPQSDVSSIFSIADIIVPNTTPYNAVNFNTTPTMSTTATRTTCGPCSIFGGTVSTMHESPKLEFPLIGQQGAITILPSHF